MDKPDTGEFRRMRAQLDEERRRRIWLEERLTGLAELVGLIKGEQGSIWERFSRTESHGQAQDAAWRRALGLPEPRKPGDGPPLHTVKAVALFAVLRLLVTHKTVLALAMVTTTACMSPATVHASLRAAPAAHAHHGRRPHPAPPAACHRPAPPAAAL